MCIYLRRFFLLSFLLVICFFCIYLLLPGASYAHKVDATLLESKGATPPIVLTVPATLPATATPTPTVAPTPTPLPTATSVPTVTPTPIPQPIDTPTATPVPTDTPTPVSTATVQAVPTPTPGSNTPAGGPTALNYLIFALGSVGVVLVIVGVILYVLYSRAGL